jgi:hypothetical protein
VQVKILSMIYKHTKRRTRDVGLARKKKKPLIDETYDHFFGESNIVMPALASSSYTASGRDPQPCP